MIAWVLVSRFVVPDGSHEIELIFFHAIVLLLFFDTASFAVVGLDWDDFDRYWCFLVLKLDACG